MRFTKLHPLAAALALAAGLSAMPAAAKNFESQHVSGMCLDARGSAAVLGSCDGDASFSGYGKIKMNNKCLSTTNQKVGMLGEGRTLAWVPCADTGAQNWGMNGNRLNNEQGYCADVEGRGTSAGTRIIGWKCDDGRPSNQRWSLKDNAPRLAPPPIAAQPGARPSPTTPGTAQPGSSLITNDGGSLIGMDGASAKGQNSAGIVSRDGAGLISDDGSTLIGQAGGNLVQGLERLAGVVAPGGGNLSGANRYSLASTGCSNEPLTRLLTDILGRPPRGSGNSGECDVSKYKGGNWKTNPDFVAGLSAAAKDQGRVARLMALLDEAVRFEQAKKGAPVAAPTPAPTPTPTPPVAQPTPPAAPAAPAAPSVPVVAGPCGDPWVNSAVSKVLGRTAVGSGKDRLECDIQRYGNGQWSNYDDLVNKVTAAYSVCSDKWVTAAVWEVKGRRPNGSGASGECDIKLYGNGSWSGYPDLVNKVRTAASSSSMQPVPAQPVSPPIAAPAPAPMPAPTPAPAPAVPVVQGPCGDPWVNTAVQKVLNRTAVGSGKNMLECDISRYGNGQWSSFDDLVNKVNAAYAVCTDKWVTAAVWEVKGRRPNGSGNTGECDIKLYGNGSWSGYPDLVNKVRAAQNQPKPAVPAPATPAPAPAPATPPMASGPCGDPWVNGAVYKVLNRTAIGSGKDRLECDIKRYGNGSWNSYDDLVNKVNATYSVCNDKWVTAAIMEVANRRPNGMGGTGECDIRKYGNGSWSGYQDLVNKVRAAGVR